MSAQLIPRQHILLNRILVTALVTAALVCPLAPVIDNFSILIKAYISNELEVKK